MEYIFKELKVILPFKIVEITDLYYQERLGEHSILKLQAIAEEENLDDYMDYGCQDTIRLLNEHSSCGQDEAVFTGRLQKLDIQWEKGLPMLSLSARSLTSDFDIKRKSRTFANLADTYENLFVKIFSDVGYNPCVDKINREASMLKSTKIRDFILQYEETDWEFAKRIATHFNSVIMCDSGALKGRFFIGLPQDDDGKVIETTEFTVIKDSQRHDRLSARIEDTFVEDVVCWEIQWLERLVTGEKLLFNKVPCCVIGLTIKMDGQLPVFIYQLQREATVKTVFKTNASISGMSLPGIVKVRKGNTVKVHFDIDESYQSNPADKDFTYNIETADWYCMPEEGSKVHIYFSKADEAGCFATNAIRVPAQDEAALKRVSNPGQKSFTCSCGAGMYLGEEEITFSPDGQEKVWMTLDRSGDIRMNGESIFLKADGEILLGNEMPEGEDEGGTAAMIPDILSIQAGKKITLTRKKDHMLEINQDGICFTGEKIVKLGESASVAGYAQAVAFLTENDEHLLKAAQNRSIQVVQEAMANARLKKSRSQKYLGARTVFKGMQSLAVMSFGNTGAIGSEMMNVFIQEKTPLKEIDQIWTEAMKEMHEQSKKEIEAAKQGYLYEGNQNISTNGMKEIMAAIGEEKGGVSVVYDLLNGINITDNEWNDIMGDISNYAQNDLRSDLYTLAERTANLEQGITSMAAAYVAAGFTMKSYIKDGIFNVPGNNRIRIKSITDDFKDEESLRFQYYEENYEARQQKIYPGVVDGEPEVVYGKIFNSPEAIGMNYDLAINSLRDKKAKFAEWACGYAELGIYDRMIFEQLEEYDMLISQLINERPQKIMEFHEDLLRREEQMQIQELEDSKNWAIRYQEGWNQEGGGDSEIISYLEQDYENMIQEVRNKTQERLDFLENTAQAENEEAYGGFLPPASWDFHSLLLNHKRKLYYDSRGNSSALGISTAENES